MKLVKSNYRQSVREGSAGSYIKHFQKCVYSLLFDISLGHLKTSFWSILGVVVVLLIGFDFIGLSSRRHVRAQTITGTCNFAQRVDHSGDGTAVFPSGNYDYAIYRFQVTADGYAGTSGTYGDINPPSFTVCNKMVDTVNGNNIGANSGLNGESLLLNGIAPVGAQLGVPRDPKINNGIWEAANSSNTIPDDRPPVYANNMESAAAIVDDAGAAFINNQTIYCQGMGSGTAANCPDITAYPLEPSPPRPQPDLIYHPGAGYLFTAPNCHLSDSSEQAYKGMDIVFAGVVNGSNTYTNSYAGQCSDSTNFAWYQNYIGANTDITSIIGQNADQSLKPFNLVLQAKNTHTSGFQTTMFVTFKYPHTGVSLAVDPVCTNKLVNGTITPAPGYNATVIATVDGVQSPIVTNNGVFSINMLDQNAHTVSANYNGLQSNTVTYGPCNQPPPPSGCTTLPNYPSPDVTVSLPDQTPYPQGGPPAYGFGSYTQNVPEGKTQVTSVNDISQGGIRVPPTKVSESYQSVTLDYTPYVQNYPYDNNQPSVNYNSYYDQYYYSASGPPVYNDYYTCDYYVANTGYYYDYATGAYDIPYTYYTCGNYTFHHDFLGYTFVQTGSAYGFTAAGTQNGPLMQYCYSRNFNLTGTSATNTYWSPSTENPTSVNFGSNVHADFTTSHGGIGVRLPLQVNTSVTANYYVRKASGQVIPYPVPGRCGGQYSTSSTNINVSDGYGTSGSADYPNTDCLNASIPPLQLGDVACFTITTSPTIGEVDPNGNTSGPRIGPVTLYVRSTAPDQPGVSCTAPIINLPYTRMYGNDVFAGGGFAGNGNSCTTPGNLLGYLGGTASGTTDQLAAYAIGIINGFGSSQMVAPDAGLQFENTGGPPGYFTGSQCASDFMSQKPAASSSIPIIGNTLIWPLVSNGASAQSMSGTVLDIPAYTIPPADVSGKANKIALFVTGDVHITGNITIGGSWTVDKAPAFYLIVTGNIFIDPGVTQLDGVYVAQPVNAANPLASEARIYTCAANASLSAAVIFQSCANQLTVNGAFVAQEVKLQRTFGSLRDALANETPAGAPHNCSISSISGTITQQPVCAAEVFNFSPEIYIAQPPFTVKGNETFDAITSLPPVL